MASRKALYRRFARLGRSDRRLIVESAFLMALVWVGLRLLPFRTLRRILDRSAASPAARKTDWADADAIDRVHWAITALAIGFPSATCLVQALAADVLLRRRGVACELRLGVRAGGTNTVPIEAHAWIECDDAVVIGAIENLSAYKLLTPPRSQ